MRNLMHELGIPLPGASSLLIDNQSAISVAKKPEHHGRMKQLDLCYYWLRVHFTLIYKTMYSICCRFSLNIE